VKGIADGCVIAGCALLGGETAEMPGLYAKATTTSRVSLSAPSSAQGFCRRPSRRRRHVRPAVIGRAFQRLFAGAPHRRAHRTRLERSRAFEPQRDLAQALLEPTRIYVKPLLAALRATDKIVALAHITGGGFPDNLPRVLPKGLGVALDLPAIPVPSVFRWLAQAGGVAQAEMLRTFNCGIGMVVVASKNGASEAEAALRAAGESPIRIGEIISATGEERVVMQGPLGL